MSVQHPADPDKRGRHPSKEDPREQGEVPRKRDDSEDHKKIPGIPSLKSVNNSRPSTGGYFSFLQIERG